MSHNIRHFTLTDDFLARYKAVLDDEYNQRHADMQSCCLVIYLPKKELPLDILLKAIPLRETLLTVIASQRYPARLGY